VRLPGSLRARLTLAALLAVGLGGAIAGVLLLAAVERDGRRAVDEDLREQAAEVLRGPPGRGRFGGGPRHGEPLLAGSGSFVQVAVGDQVVASEGDVPADAPVPRSSFGSSDAMRAPSKRSADGAPVRAAPTVRGGCSSL